MLKSKLALIVGALALAGSAHAAEIYNKDGNKLDLYGKVKGNYLWTNGAGADATYARLGFKGETEISEGLKGFGQWEYNIDASKPEGSQSAGKTRLAFVGLDAGDAGSVSYGRNYGVVYNVEAYTDMLPEFGGDSYTGTDLYLTGRGNSFLTYTTNNLWGAVDGLALSLQYQAENKTDRPTQKNNGQGYGASVNYDIADTGVSVGAAYANSERVGDRRYDILGNDDGHHAEVWTVGAKYDANSIYLATMYAETRGMNSVDLPGTNLFLVTDKTKAFEAVAQYQFDNGLRPSLAYVQSTGEKYGVTADLVKYTSVGATYYFNKNFSVDAEYKFNLAKDTQNLGIATDDQVAVGATYQF